MNLSTTIESSLNRRTYLMKELRERRPGLLADDVWKATADITEDQYGYLLALIYQNDPSLNDAIRNILKLEIN